MARKYDIAKKILNGNARPTVKIDDGHEFRINNGKSAALMMQAIIDESGEGAEALDKIVILGLGKEAHEYIESLDLPLPVYNDIANVIMAAFSDISLEEMEELAKEQQGKK